MSTASDISVSSDPSLGLKTLQFELANIMTDTESKEDTPANPTDSTTEFKVGDLTFRINTKNPVVNKPSEVGVHFRKEHRPEPGSKAEIELIRLIVTNHYDSYSPINTSIKDPESLRTNLTLHGRLLATEASWRSFDMLKPCNILFPDPTTNGIVPILDAATGKPKTLYLFKDYRKVTALQVANSCAYFAKYITFPTVDSKGEKGTGDFTRELAWSYSHFRNHVDPRLYDAVNKEFLRFKPEQQGGPLFLKLLLDKLVVNNDAHLAALVTTTTKYNIKQMNPQEDISEVISLLDSISETIIALRDNEEHPLPEQYVQNIMKVLQTTSVDKFNDSFRMLEEQLTFNRRLQHSLESPEFANLSSDSVDLNLPTTGNLKLDNTPRSLRVLWTFASTTYNELRQDGTWDEAVRPPVEQVNFNQAIKCWNCGKNHSVNQCPEPLDQERIEKNKQEFLKEKRKRKADKKPPHAWRPPEPDEHGKRIIYDKPYTWNEARNGWDKDETPEHGLSANKAATPPKRDASQSSRSHTLPTDDDATIVTQSTIPAHELSQIQLDLANVTQALHRYV